jgi:hypothetical protein
MYLEARLLYGCACNCWFVHPVSGAPSCAVQFLKAFKLREPLDKSVSTKLHRIALRMHRPRSIWWSYLDNTVGRGPEEGTVLCLAHASTHQRLHFPIPHLLHSYVPTLAATLKSCMASVRIQDITCRQKKW